MIVALSVQPPGVNELCVCVYAEWNETDYEALAGCTRAIYFPHSIAIPIYPFPNANYRE
jgi:hypothetical protein